jgi:hypothetical protein
MGCVQFFLQCVLLEHAARVELGDRERRESGDWHAGKPRGVRFVRREKARSMLRHYKGKRLMRGSSDYS